MRRNPRAIPNGGRGLQIRRRRRSLGSRLINEFQSAHDSANAANEQRYQDILQGYDDLHGRVVGGLSQVGNQERADIDRVYRNQAANVNQTLINRGFGNSSLLATMQNGVMREQRAAHNRLEDQLMRTRAGFDTNITAGKLGVMERRTDQGPDFNQLVALSQGLGRAGQVGRLGIGRIGISPGAYQNAFQGMLGRHLGLATLGSRGGGRTQAFHRNRKKRASPFFQLLMEERRARRSRG